MQVFDKLYINGTWVQPHGKESIDVHNSSTEEVMARVPLGDETDVDLAVRAARKAFDGWSATPPAQRSAFLQKIHEALKDQTDAFARAISAEVGMPYKLSQRVQVGMPTFTFGAYARMLADYPFEEKVGNSLVAREPVGVVAAITPWNYPLHQIASKVAAALAAGCTVILKPSEVAPVNAFMLAELIHAAGVPAGVFNLVSGTGPTAGEALARHPDVDMVSFTGSTRAGKRVSELASQTIKRVALELGGKSAAVILEDADLAAAVKGTLNNCYLNSGQTCSAHTRMLVPESRYAEAARLAVEMAKGFTPGDAFADTTRLGPLVSAAQRERVRGYIKKGVAEGAELLCGGAEPPANLPRGYFVQPTVLGRVDPKSTVAQEEIFGPVLSILTYKDEDDAVRIANDSLYGLAGGVWSASDERAIKVARRMRTGQVDINGGAFNLMAPFGGYKQSGNGREFGRPGLEEFLEYKAMQLKEKKT
ncbi:MAG TPA: aldehyde dehydrogenase family protein [Burkholderiales bacterium]|nr:aldehyde dehydrogenase family protein [Burkholderiales bacterium]